LRAKIGLDDRGEDQAHPSDEDLSPGTPDFHPSDEDLSPGTPDFHPSDEDLSPGTPDFHPSDEDLSLGTPDFHRNPSGWGLFSRFRRRSSLLEFAKIGNSRRLGIRQNWLPAPPARK
jgi:hypothetical protein